MAILASNVISAFFEYIGQSNSAVLSDFPKRQGKQLADYKLIEISAKKRRYGAVTAEFFKDSIRLPNGVDEVEQNFKHTVSRIKSRSDGKQLDHLKS